MIDPPEKSRDSNQSSLDRAIDQRVHCIVCNSVMSAQQSWLYKCNSCGFRSSTLNSGAGRGVDGLNNLRKKNYRTILNHIQQYKSLNGLHLLEVGCAEGWFLEEAKRRGLTTLGIEPSSKHANIARAKGFKVIQDFFPNDKVKNSQFDCLIFNDVFEHLPNPVEALQACEELLVPGGLLIINLPSSNGFFYRLAELMQNLGNTKLMQRLWQVGLPSPHLSYFNASTLNKLIVGYSSLHRIDQFKLDSLNPKGMAQRIHKSEMVRKMAFVFEVVTAVALPVLRILPSDIIVGIFKKPECDGQKITAKATDY